MNTTHSGRILEYSEYIRYIGYWGAIGVGLWAWLWVTSWDLGVTFTGACNFHPHQASKHWRLACHLVLDAGRMRFSVIFLHSQNWDSMQLKNWQKTSKYIKLVGGGRYGRFICCMWCFYVYFRWLFLPCCFLGFEVFIPLRRFFLGRGWR